jgi:hypothetical protein
MIADRMELANTSDRHSGARLLVGLAPLFPRINIVIADAGHESRRRARQLMRQDGWKLQIDAVNVFSRSPGSPGLWSARSHGSAATVDSANIL